MLLLSHTRRDKTDTRVRDTQIHEGKDAADDAGADADEEGEASDRSEAAGESADKQRGARLRRRSKRPGDRVFSLFSKVL